MFLVIRSIIQSHFYLQETLEENNAKKVEKVQKEAQRAEKMAEKEAAKAEKAAEKAATKAEKEAERKAKAESKTAAKPKGKGKAAPKTPKSAAPVERAMEEWESELISELETMKKVSMVGAVRVVFCGDTQHRSAVAQGFVCCEMVSLPCSSGRGVAGCSDA